LDDGPSLRERDTRGQWYGRHHPCQPPCLEDLSIYIIFILPYSPIRAIDTVSGATSGDRFLAACMHLHHGRVPVFHCDTSISEHTTFAWYVSVVQVSRPCPRCDRMTVMLCFRLAKLWSCSITCNAAICSYYKLAAIGVRMHWARLQARRSSGRCRFDQQQHHFCGVV